LPRPSLQPPVPLAFAFSPRCVEHDTGPHHPERPDRIRAIARAVRQAGLIDSPDPFPQFKFDSGLKPPPSAPPKLLELSAEPADERLTLLVHTHEHLRRVRHVCAVGGALDDGDTPVSPGSDEIALLSLGLAIAAGEAVVRGTARRAFAACRPPGHHAEPHRAMGFCLFSNIAILARYLRRAHGVGKIAIVDFDVHHGNGTQAAFEEDPTILFISLHQDPRTLYPGTGYASEIGRGLGEGFTINIPLMPGSDDGDYLAAIDGQVLPALEKFAPEILLTSAGFDAHAADPLSQMLMTEEGYFALTRRLVDFADARCNGRLVSVLEGGYNLLALSRGTVAHLRAMM
jgi:acetoin utilization deacetylase AcuC-like enzyme